MLAGCTVSTVQVVAAGGGDEGSMGGEGGARGWVHA